MLLWDLKESVDQRDLADYDLDEQAIDAVVNNLEKNELTTLGEHGDIDLAKVKQILALAL